MEINVSKNSNKRKFTIFAEIKDIGRDLLIILTGGDCHIGAVSTAQLCRGINNTEKLTSSVSTLTFYGHQDNEVTKIISKTVSRSISRNVVTVGGMHWDRLSPEELNEILLLVNELIDKIIYIYSGNG